MEIVITNNKTCHSVYFPENKIVRTTFRGIVNYGLMKEHMANILRFSEDNQILGALIDFSLLRGSYFKIFGHLKEDIYPKLVARGFNVQAFIISDDILTANVTKRLVTELDKLNGKVKLFTNIDEAKDWVLVMIKNSTPTF